MSFNCIILAAGQGLRMKSERPKVLHELLGVTLIRHIVQTVLSLKPNSVYVVVGHKSELIKKELEQFPVNFVHQEKQIGTGHAVMACRNNLERFNGDILILNGDSPLITTTTLRSLMKDHSKTKSILSLLTAELEDPAGYGRVIRDGSNKLRSIVEQKDCSREQRGIKEINSGVYCVGSKFLWNSLKKLNSNNAQNEIYLPDIISVAYNNNDSIGVAKLKDANEILGINTRAELSCAEKILRERINYNHMQKGVTIIDPASTYISTGVRISSDVTIYPNTYIYGSSKIGNNTNVGPSVWIRDSKIGSNVNVRMNCYIEEAVIGNNIQIGPFANLRPESVISDDAKIGNFVELKKSFIGKGSKVPHLSYVGDATLGEGVNIGAGTITCNYDGVNKNKTEIHDGAFIGSDTMLVAPVVVGKNATTAAGSTITKNVDDNSLAIERSKQVAIKNWNRNRKKK